MCRHFITIFALLVITYVDAAVKKSGKADLTNYESYPLPGSKECEPESKGGYNGCKWQGQFAFVDGKQSLEWVKSHKIISIHEKDSAKYKLKTFRIKQGGRHIDAKVYDECSDKDCKGCCTKNSKKTGFLIDMEKYTLEQFGGSGDGTVEWECLDC